MNRLNKESHIVEELNGVRCSIVEKNATPARAEFLKKILEANGLTVLIAQVPPPKPIPPKPIPAGIQKPTEAKEPVLSVSEGPPPPPPGPAPDLYNVGVTLIAFHAMLAIYERTLKTADGKYCTIAHWNQESEKEGWYWKR